MPAQKRLRADQEREPDRARQPSAETGQRQTISRSPAGPLDLALEDTQLVSEDEELQPEVGVGALAVDEGVEEQTEGGIEDRESTVSHPGRWDSLSPALGPSHVPRSGFLDRTGTPTPASGGYPLGGRATWRRCSTAIAGVVRADGLRVVDKSIASGVVRGTPSRPSL